MLGNDKNKNNNNFEYISLQDAVKFCNYSQEYLSLRARQGKLKSMKLGRNWVTTKEWLVEYAGKVDEYNNSINNNGRQKSARRLVEENVKEKIIKDQIVHSPPENLPIVRYPNFKISLGTLRPGFAAALVFVLITAGGVLGKESLLKTYNDIAQVTEKIVQNMAAVSDDVFTATINYKSAFVAAPGIISDYGQWLKNSYTETDKKIEQKIGNILLALAPEKAGKFIGNIDKNIELKIGNALLSLEGAYFSIDRSVEQKFTDLGKSFIESGQKIAKTHVVVNNFIKQKSIETGERIKNFEAGFKSETMRLVNSVGEPFTRAYRFAVKSYQYITLPWREVIPKELGEGVVVKRVEVSRVIEPVREVTKETIQQITKIDATALAEVRANMVYLEEEIGKRLYAPGGVISQTIYVTEPVSSPKIYQENGEIVLQTRGSGNVILSAATGLQLYGQQVVIEATNLLNPLIYLASKTRIGGDTTINGATAIGGTLSVGGAAIMSGNLTVNGTFSLIGGQTIGGNLIVSGGATSTFAGPIAITTSTTAHLKLAYDASNYTNFGTNSTGDLTITPSGGNVTIAGNLLVNGSPNYTGGANFLTPVTITTTSIPQFLLRYDADNELNLSIADDGALLFLATGTDPDMELSTRNFDDAFFIDDSAKMIGIATSSPRYKFDVWGDMAIGTSTGTNIPALYVDSGDGGRIGIGTTTLAGLLTVGTSTPRLVVAPDGNIGIASSTPSDIFSVQGNIISSGNVSFYGTSATTTISGGLIVGTNTLWVPAGGNIGIATSSPRYKFDVWGDMAIGTSTGVSAPMNYPLLYVNSGEGGSSNGVGIGTTTLSGLLTVGTSTAVFTIDSLNNIGVATSSPSAKLAVSGNIFGTGQVIFTYAPQSGGAGNIADSSLYINASGALSDANLFGIADAGTWKFRVDKEGDVFLQGNLTTTGSVSQGTTTITDLVVEGHSFLGDSSNNDYVVIQGTTTISVNNTNPALTVTQVGTGYGAIITGGNVGVGTTTPRYAFDVWGDMAIGTSTGTNVPLLYVDSGTGLGGVGIGTTTLSGNLFTVGTTTPALVVSPLSYVGIGTSTPSTNFAVAGNIMGSGNIVLYGTATSTFVGGISALGFNAGGNGITNAIWNGTNVGLAYGGTGATLTDPNADRIMFWDDSAGATTWLTVGANLNLNGTTLSGQTSNWQYIGLNAIRPTSTIGIIVSASSTFTGDLTVNSDAYTSNSFFVDASTGRVGIGTSTLAGLLTVGTSTPALVVDPTGKIGIGTATPLTQLHLSGSSGAAALRFEETDGAADEKAWIVRNYSGGFEVRSVNDANNNSKQIFVINRDGFNVDKIWFAEGNLGIGNNNPSSKLTVNGGNIVVSSTGAATTTISSGISTFAGGFISQASSTFTGDLTVNSDAYTSNSFFVDASTGQIGIGTTTLAGLLTVGTSTPYFIIDPTGKTGIATTSPSAQLAVAGNMMGSGNIILYGTNASSSLKGLITTGLNVSGSGITNAVWNGTNIGLAYGGTGATLTDPNADRIMFWDDSLGATTWLTVGANLNLTDTTLSGQTSNWQYIGVNAIRPTSTIGIIVSASSTFTGDLTVAGNAFYVNSTNGRVGLGTTTLAGLFTVGTSTPRLVVAPDGNIGIASSTPSDVFSVQGNIISSGNVSFYGSSATTTIGGGLVVGTNTLWVPAGGSVGIGTTTPRYKLDVWGDMAIGTSTGVAVSMNYPLLYVNSGEGGSSNGVGIGTTTVSGAMLTVGTTTAALVVSQNGNVIFVQNAGNVGIGTTTPEAILSINSAASNAFIVNSIGNVGIGTLTPSAKLTIAGAGSSTDFAIGDFSAVIIDSIESTLGWTSYNTTVVGVALNTSNVKVGAQSLNIWSTTSSEDVYVAKDYSSSQNWSSYERLGFWIKASKLATSTATTTQIISSAIFGTSNNVTTTHQIAIQKENRWQYEEWNISGIQNSTSVDRIAFRIDVADTSAINFYIDQIRLYDDTERTGELFVDKDGVLVAMGRGGVELVSPQTGAGSLPGVKIDAAVVELGQPLSVNVGGDVGFDYDIQFLNTGLAQITSEGPLRIAAGDSNHSENLTLTTGGSGDVIVEINASSSAFMIMQAWAASTTVPFIINSESNSTTTAEMDKLGILFQVISDYSSDENTVFSIDASGNIYYDRGAYTPAADVAEKYYVEDESIEAGDVVCLNNTPLTVEKCSGAYESDLLGVISTQPALLMGNDMLSARPVALNGRVPVKVSIEGGTIAIGDSLTSASSTSGVAMKATASGKILGYALEPFDGSATSSNMIFAFINLQDRTSGDLTVFENLDGNIEVKVMTQNGLAALFKLDAEGALVVDKIKTNQLCVGSLCVTEADFIRVFGASAAGALTTSTAATTSDVVVPDLPNSVIDSTPETTTTSTEAAFVFHSTKENSTFTCQIDGNMWAGCSSPKTYIDLSAGFHEFQVQAIDAQNHEDPSPAVFNWQIIAGEAATSTATTTP